MKKNLIIVFLSIISITSLVYGYTQKEKADEQEGLAKEYFIMAEEEKKRATKANMEALEQRKQAELSAEKAREQMLLALKHIQNKQKEAE